MIPGKIDIPKRKLQCSKNSHVFTQGDSCYTFVFEDQSGWQRQDLCETCWNALQDQGLPSHIKSYWQTKIPLQTALNELPKQKSERALALLKEMLGNDEKEREAFVLALYLVRKKVLQQKQEVERLGEVVLLYEVIRTEELLPIKKIKLHPRDTDILQKHLADMLTNPC